MAGGASVPPERMSKVAAVMCLSRSLLEQNLRPASANITIPEIPGTCTRHLRFQLLSRSESLALDPILAHACEADRKRFCAHVPEGFGQVRCNRICFYLSDYWMSF